MKSVLYELLMMYRGKESRSLSKTEMTSILFSNFHLPVFRCLDFPFFCEPLTMVIQAQNGVE